ncbi:MAG TPA: hypothetical protein VGS23_01320 [Thermoplasmata archaeon]|nr:hypothetical protein [Thermoplasmata archaeon]
MPREKELVDPIAGWLYDQFSPGRTLLVHEEPQGHHGGRPDILCVFAEPGDESVNDVTLVPIEIEVSSRTAIRDPRNGLRQLKKYAGHAKYLAIPKTVAARQESRRIPTRSKAYGFGLLIVDVAEGNVESVVEPEWGVARRGLRSYPKSMERWIALRKSADRYRRISGQAIVDKA